MNIILEFFIVSISFWFVSNRMEGIHFKKKETIFIASLVYSLSYALLKTLLFYTFKVFTLGFFSMSYIAIVLAALGAMLVVIMTVKDFKIESFPVMAAAIFVIAIVASILRVIIF